MAKRKTPKITHYVYDSGSGVVSRCLMQAKTDDFEKIYEHPETSCFDLRGHLVKLPLYEVPQEILDKLLQARLKGEMTFRRFVQKGDSIPVEMPEEAPAHEGSKKAGSKRRLSENGAGVRKSSPAMKKAKADLKRIRARARAAVA